MTTESNQPNSGEEVEMRLKPSEVRIVNAVRALTPQSRIHISKHESGDLNIQTHERIQNQGRSGSITEGSRAGHKSDLRD